MRKLIVLAITTFALSIAYAAETMQTPTPTNNLEVKPEVKAAIKAEKTAAANAPKAEGDFSNETTETADMPVGAEKPVAPAPKATAAPATAPPASSAPATAEAKPKGKYEGMFTFDWKRLTKCQIIGPITNAMLVDPKNVCKKGDRSTNSPASCKVSDKSEYLIFKTLEDCKVEYDEQLKASP